MEKLKTFIIFAVISLIPIMCFFDAISLKNTPQKPKEIKTHPTYTIGEPISNKYTFDNYWWGKYLAPSNPTVEFKSNVPAGFRKIKWGDSIEKHKDILLEVDAEDHQRLTQNSSSILDSEVQRHAWWEIEYKLYRVVGDKLKIGNVVLRDIIYCFTPETGLLRVDIYCESSAHSYFESRWGASQRIWPTKKENHIAQWHGNDITATIYPLLQEPGPELLSLVSLKLTNKYARLWRDETTIAEKKRKQEYNKAVLNDF